MKGINNKNLARFEKFLKNEPVMAILERNITFLLDEGKRVGAIEINSGLQSYIDGVSKKVVVSGVPSLINDQYGPLEWTAMMRVNLAHEIQHDNSSDFELLEKICKWFGDYMQKNHNIRREIAEPFAQSILNCVEDGRIDDIVVQRFPGYLTMMRFVALACRGFDELKGAAQDSGQELLDFQNQIMSYSITGLNLQGIEVYHGKRLEKEFMQIRPFIDEGVASPTAKGCFDACVKILTSAAQYIADLMTATSNIMDILEKLFKENYSQSSDTRKENTGDPGSGITIRINVPSGGSSQSQEGQNSDDEGQGQSSNSKRDSQKGSGDAGKGEQSGKDGENGSGTGKSGKGKNKPGEEGKGDGDGNKKADESGKNGKDGEKDSKSGKDGKDAGEDKQGNQNSSLSGGSKSDGKGEADDGKGESGGKNNGGKDTKKPNQNANCIEDVIGAQFQPDPCNPISKEEMQRMLDEIRDVLRDTKARIAANHVDPGKKTPLSKKDLATLKETYGSIKLLESFVTPNPQQVLPEIKTQANRLHERLATILEKRQVAAAGYKKGYLAPGKLWKSGIGSSDIFQRKQPPKLADCAVYELIDGSGSMCSPVTRSGSKNMNRLESALTTASIMEEALKGLASTKVTIFRGGYNEVQHIVVKDFAQKPIGSRCFDALSCTWPTGGNKDGYSIRVAAMDLAKRPEKTKILVVLSDGLPSAYDSVQTAMSDVRSAAKWARMHGITVISIMFGDDSFLSSNYDSYISMYEEGVIAVKPPAISSAFEKLLLKYVK